MFKLLNLIVTIFVFYWLFESLDGMNTGFNVAVETGNSAMLIYKGFYSLFYTLWLVAVYIAVFGGKELYVTTKVIAKDEKENNQEEERGNVA